MSQLNISIADKSYCNTQDKSSKQVIKAFNLTLNKDEFVCLVGSSGCGKTTLLNILAGLDVHFSGAITLTGQQHAPKVGYVFQNPRLLPWRSVQENIALAATNATPESIDELLDSMGMTAEKNSYPEHLSLGMSRRVSIIRAFATQPDLLLMDEPLVSLDPPSARQVRQLLLNLWQQRPHKILYVTHDLREAISLADRLIFLDSHPMTVLREVAVTIPRSARHNEQHIEHFRQQLFIDYPEIIKLL